MEPNYRPADMIELHDSGFIIVRKGYPDAINGWREYVTTEGRSYAIDGEQVLRFAEYFGINYVPVITQHNGEKELRSSLRDETFVFQTEATKVGSSAEGHYELFQVIKELSAFVEAPQLLHMRVVFMYENTSDGTADEETKFVTYSGRFTIWWSGASQ